MDDAWMMIVGLSDRRQWRNIPGAAGDDGLPPAGTIDDANTLRRAVETVKSGGSPTKALDRLAREAARLQRRSMIAHKYELMDIERVPLPELFLKPGELPLAVAVTHYRAPGAAWGQYVVFVLTHE